MSSVLSNGTSDDDWCPPASALFSARSSTRHGSNPFSLLSSNRQTPCREPTEPTLLRLNDVVGRPKRRGIVAHAEDPPGWLTQPPGWQQRHDAALDQHLNLLRLRREGSSSNTPRSPAISSCKASTCNLIPKACDLALEAPVLPPLVGAWWRRPSLTKAQLAQVLLKAKTNTDRDRAVALLRRYEPTPRHELDHEGVKKLLKPTEFQQLRGFLCWRCDKVYQTLYAASWKTSRGSKQICHGCHKEFVDREEEEERKANPFKVALAATSIAKAKRPGTAPSQES